MPKLRIAVVGSGHLGAFHAKVYAALEGRKKYSIDFAYVCDVNKKTAKEVAKRYNVDYVTNHRDLLGKVDAVSIVVPTSLHHIVAKDFLNAGVHVLIEKPITKNTGILQYFIVQMPSQELLKSSLSARRSHI